MQPFITTHQPVSHQSDKTTPPYKVKKERDYNYARIDLYMCTNKYYDNTNRLQGFI